VKLFGVLSGEFCIATDGIGFDIEESSGFSHSASFDDVFDDGDDFFFGQTRVEKNGASPFGEAFVARATPQQSGVIGTVGISNADIFCAANAELGAIFIGTAKLVEVIRDRNGAIHILENIDSEYKKEEYKIQKITSILKGHKDYL
jgi:hypothetical protein